MERIHQNHSTLKKEVPNLQVVVAKSDNITFPVLDKSFKVETNAKIAIIASDVAIVASGTATLECAVEERLLLHAIKFLGLHGS